jgi:hypothetical protein
MAAVRDVESVPPMRIPTSLKAIGSIAILSVLTACAPSIESLEAAVDEKPGVAQVRVEDVDGDDDLPFASIPKNVTVWMERDASGDQVRAVLAAYEDDIDDEDIVSLDVILAGGKDATLSLGQGIQGTESMVDDLMDAEQDADVIEYRHEAHPVAESVYLTITDGGAVRDVAGRYPEADYVEVQSGTRVFVRDGSRAGFVSSPAVAGR